MLTTFCGRNWGPRTDLVLVLSYCSGRQAKSATLWNSFCWRKYRTSGVQKDFRRPEPKISNEGLNKTGQWWPRQRGAVVGNVRSRPIGDRYLRELQASGPRPIGRFPLPSPPKGRADALCGSPAADACALVPQRLIGGDGAWPRLL